MFSFINFFCFRILMNFELLIIESTIIFRNLYYFNLLIHLLFSFNKVVNEITFIRIFIFKYC